MTICLPVIRSKCSFRVDMSAPEKRGKCAEDPAFPFSHDGILRLINR